MSDVYEPGSVFKVVDDVRRPRRRRGHRPTRRFDDRGYVTEGGVTISNWDGVRARQADDGRNIAALAQHGVFLRGARSWGRPSSTTTCAPSASARRPASTCPGEADGIVRDNSDAGLVDHGPADQLLRSGHRRHAAADGARRRGRRQRGPADDAADRARGALARPARRVVAPRDGAPGHLARDRAHRSRT